MELTPTQIELRNRMTANSKKFVELTRKQELNRRGDTPTDAEIEEVIRERDEIRAAARKLMGV